MKFGKKKLTKFQTVRKTIRGLIMYCKLWLVEKTSTWQGRDMKRLADEMKEDGGHIFSKRYWKRIGVRRDSNLYLIRAGLCRYARRKGTYKNL